MKIVFLSNFLNHHQLPICLEFQKKIGDNFKFIATTNIFEEQLKLGYEDMNHKYKFVVCAYESTESLKRAKKLCDEADVVITGSAPEWYLKKRKKENKMIFRYSERPLKRGLEPVKYIPRLIKWNFLNPCYKKIYMLCASAYTSTDYSKFGLFKGKCYKWGYFPEVKLQNVEEVFKNKNSKGYVSILWVGRFIDIKHPETAIEIARKLKEAGKNFQLDIIGGGELQNTISNIIEKQNLTDCVHVLGTMPPDKVREHMENADIFMFTSDFNEGWGAVLNEAMNSCCAVVASHAIGSVPFLIKNGYNGFIYNNANIEDAFGKVCELVDNCEKRRLFGENAYYTLQKTWNAHVAVERLLKLFEGLMNGNYMEIKEGPCSIAKNITNNWFK